MIKNSTDSEMLTPITLYPSQKQALNDCPDPDFSLTRKRKLAKEKYFEQSISNAKVGICTCTCIFFDNIFLLKMLGIALTSKEFCNRGRQPPSS